MQIWVDADACPRVIKEILYRAAERKKVRLTLVANQPLRTPDSPYIHTMVVAAGFDVADNRAELEAICRYSQEQYLSERPITVEELFAPETLDMPGV